MRLRCVLAALAVLLALGAESGAPAAERKTKTRWVRSDAQFAAAVKAMRGSGGRIVLLPHLYRQLVVPPRSSWPLRIVGRRGARIESMLFLGTQHVSLGGVVVAPVYRDALVEVRESHHIDLHDLLVTAKDTRFSASVLLSEAHDVTVRRNTFTHCGDRSAWWANCVLLYRWTHRIVIEGNRFHDCQGCDFVHGRFGTHLTIRRNTFDRTLPCHLGRYRCGHQDLVQLFAGRRLLVEGNRFGVYRDGGAQLYLTNNVDYATVVNNVFVGTDPRVPGYRARMAIVVGSNRSRRLPYYTKLVNNTILTGYRRRDGYEGSIRMSSRYGGLQRWKRPIVANNVIALLETPGRVCLASQRFLDNIVVQGRGCRKTDLVGPADLDARGRPRKGSSVVDGGNRHYAPATDATGRRRTGKPDIGAFEYRSGG